MCGKYLPLVETVDLLLAEQGELSSAGPRFRIVHRFRTTGTDCAPGEEIVAVYLIYRSRPFLVPLSLALRMVFDYLAHHSHLPQSASQIAAGMHADLFYRKHGANALAMHEKMTRKISRASLREYVKRIRLALERAFREAEVTVKPESVLISEETVTNEVGYRAKASFEWLHVDHRG